MVEKMTTMDPSKTSMRLLSLDVMRGAIMILLMLESTGFYENLLLLGPSIPVKFIMLEFFHHPWHGLHFWDLVQPAFMFMAGISMAYSLHHQQINGVPWTTSFLKVLKRSGWLFFWGVLDYAVRKKGLSFELWDVLTQLSFTTLVTFLIFKWSYRSQIIFSIGLLILTEVLYRYSNVAGFDQPFTDQHNFGNFMDLILMNKINSGGWVAINCIPTAAHTIWGSIAGCLLISNKKGSDKIKILIISGVVAIILGYGLDLSITPIIKRIATSSFVLVSGGWVLLILSLFYWGIDIMNNKKYVKFFVVVGMNSLFIYLFFEIVGSRWFNSYISSLSNGIMQLVGLPINIMEIVSSLVIFLLEWGLCFFLYKKRIFFKI